MIIYLRNFSALFFTFQIIQTFLTIATVAGCSVSIACLFLNGFFVLLSGQHSTSKQIDVCLSLTLAMAQVFVISALENQDLTGDGLVCTILAVAMHYLFLTSFSWMFIKGVHLYLNVMKVHSRLE